MRTLNSAKPIVIKCFEKAAIASDDDRCSAIGAESSTFSVFRPLSCLRHVLYCDPPTLLGLNFTSTKTVLRPVLLTNKKWSNYRGRSKLAEVKISKYRKSRRYENGPSTEKVELMRSQKCPYKQF